MFGVIIWSDPFVKKAVIWCEDQGNLAYYEAPQNVSRIDESFFDEGDYVEFEVEMDQDLCRASNAQIVVSMADKSLKRHAGPPRRISGRAPEPLAAPPQIILFADHAVQAGHSAPRFNRRG